MERTLSGSVTCRMLVHVFMFEAHGEVEVTRQNSGGVMTLRSFRGAAVLAAVVAMSTESLGAQDTKSVAQICIAPPGAQVATGNSADAANVVREAFTSYLTGPTLAVVTLTARLPSQAREEAKQASCPHVLFTVFKHERKQGTGLLGKMASGAVQGSAWELRGAAQTAAGRVAANAAANAAIEAARAYSGNVKSKDEITLEYRVESTDGAVIVKSAGKAKAEADGQDLLTPLVEKAAEAVAGAVLKGRR